MTTPLYYSRSLQESLLLASSMASAEGHSSFGVAHLVLALLHESSSSGLRDLICSMHKDLTYVMEWFDTYRELYVPKEEDKDTENAWGADNDVLHLLEESERSKIKLGQEELDGLCVLLAVVRRGVVYSDSQLQSLELEEEELLRFFEASESILPNDKLSQLLVTYPFVYPFSTEAACISSNIQGRAKELRHMEEALERLGGQAVLLVGASGIGKTRLIEAFVQRLQSPRVGKLSELLPLGLDVAKLIASSADEREQTQRISSLLTKLQQMEESSLLVIDDVQMLLDAGHSTKSSMLLSILQRALDKGEVNLLISTSADAYRQHWEKHSLSHRAEVLNLEELPKDWLVSILKERTRSLCEAYKLSISPEAYRHALWLSSRFFKEKNEPAASLDLLERTLAAASLSNDQSQMQLRKFREELERLTQSAEDESKETESQEALQLLEKSLFSGLSVLLTSRLQEEDAQEHTHQGEKSSLSTLEHFAKCLDTLQDIAERGIASVGIHELDALVAERTGIPLGKLQAGEKERLLNIEERLAERVKGQGEAIEVLSDAIIESRSGLSDPRKPIGSFFFLGPTGTGKTELAKSLAELLFDDEGAMIRFDMSEFKEEHAAALLYGAPPGYVGYEEGGLLVSRIRQKPYSVVLFDEIEKAHSSIYDVFLQLMDEGKIHDKLGREGDFSNAIVIFTSNIGSQWIAEQITAGKRPSSNALIEVMTDYFRPEFLGRLTEVVPFAPINEAIAREIFLLHFGRLQKQLQEEKQVSLTLSESALAYLAQKGYSAQYGARPIAGVIRSYLKKQVARLMVAEEIKAGDSVLVDYAENSLKWELC